MTVNLPLQNPGRVRGGLESVSEPIGVPESEWRTGVTVTPQCGQTTGVYGCDAGPDGVAPTDIYPTGTYPAAATEKAVNSAASSSMSFYPGLVYSIAKCGNGSPSSVLADAAAITARNTLERQSYSKLARMLYDGKVGAPEGDNPSWKSLAVAPAGFDNAAPACLLPTIQGLLDGRVNMLDPNAVLHVPQPYLPYFLAYDIVDFDRVTGRYWMGDVAVSFDDYQNLGPTSVAGATTAADGSELWMYLTSTPRIELAGIEVVAARKVQMNQRQVRAERGALALFDPCAVYAAKAKVCAL